MRGRRIPSRGGQAARRAVADLATGDERRLLPGGLVDVAVASGTIQAVTFIADPQHILHDGSLPEDDIASILAAGVGPGGTAPAYLSSTAGALRVRGIPDAYLERLEAAVARRLRR